MEPETQHAFENEDDFWQELHTSVATSCDTHSLIDDALRSYLILTTGYPDFVQSDHDLRRCAYQLYSSPLFATHPDYIRRQFVHCLLQDDDPSILHITTTFLLSDARENEPTFELLNNEGVFPRLVHLIYDLQQSDEEGLHRLLMELMYEIARIQKVTNDDLVHVNDDFICSLFEIIEQVSGNVDDPYHYPVIRVLLVLNEQFMVAAHDPTAVTPDSVPLTNKVMKVLSGQGARYKTFGENIILLLNREDETSLQLLTLKLLYLLFTTPPTYEYFYTNDLHVLVDILIRNLLDLPEEAAALRHTYLRVLYPLLEHTQLKDPPHYKREEVRKLLSVLAGGQYVDEQGDSSIINHFEEVDDTTKRLVNRCQTVSWLMSIKTGDPQPVDIVESPTDDNSSPTKLAPPALPAPRKLKKRNPSKGSGSGPYLMPQMESARKSSLSMVEMATQKEKPGVITPSRNPSVKQGLREAMMRKKERPPPPKARRSGWARLRDQKPPLEAGPTLPAPAEDEEAADEVEDQALDEKLNKVLAEERTSRHPKPPPPAPKTRRWRGKTVKEESQPRSLVEPGREPGMFNANLPSIKMPHAETSFELESPFSPPERTLSEHSPFSLPPERSETTTEATHESIDSFDTKKAAKRISSVSAALGQAQAQALHDLEQTLDKATIQEEPEGEHEHHSNTQNNMSPTIQHRAILAPPGQAPMRGVPGPKMELERSPFLSDNENENDNEDVEGSSPELEAEVEAEAGVGLGLEVEPQTHASKRRRKSGDISTGEESSDDEWN